MLLPLMVLIVSAAVGLPPSGPVGAIETARAGRAATQSEFQLPVGPFLGQRPPGTTPQPFAQDLSKSLGMSRAPVFTADGNQAFWAQSTGRFRARLVTSRLQEKGWTRPESLSFSTGEFFDHNPAISANGRRLVFASNRPIPGKAATTLPGTDVPTSDLWIAEWSGDRWSEPRPLDQSVNTEADEDCPVFAADNVLYFSSSRPSPGGSPGGIFRAVGGDRGFTNPERLPAPVSEAGEMVSGVGPNEEYLLFYSMRRGNGGGLCLSFRSAAGSWSKPVPLSPLFGDIAVYAAAVTFDGRWLLLSATGTKAGLYWMSAEVLPPFRSTNSTAFER